MSRPCRVAFLVAMALLNLRPAAGQGSGYSVTGALSPFFIHPVTGADITQGYPFTAVAGWERGADGFFYGLRTSGSSLDGYPRFEIVQASPTTGEVRVLYVAQSPDRPSDFFRGRDGRLYFTVADGAHIWYAAPGHLAEGCSDRGCVMLLDTGGFNAPLRAYYAFQDPDGEGTYPREIALEDVDGALYVETSEGFCGWQVVKIPITTAGWGDGTYSCGASFDWSTIIPSDNRWHWSDGRRYGGVGQDIYRYEFPNPPVLMARIAVGHGVPQGLVEGGGYLYGITLGGGPLGGGVVFRVRVPSLASPDLEVTSLSPPRAVAAPGESFAVTDTTQNVGPEPAAASRTSYYLSRTGETADIKLVNNRYLPELKAGEESTGPRTVKVPDAVPSGMYWLLACADTAHDVLEGDELNNCRSAGSAMTIGTPDLRATTVETTATFATPGGKMTASDTVDNASLFTAGTSTTRYYLSLDVVRSAGDVLLSTGRAIGSLGSGETSTGSRSVVVPAGTSAGTYHVLACADDLSKVAESDEANNCAASASTVVVGFADLVTSALSSPPAERAIGTTFTVSDTAINQVSSRAAASTTRYYLSLDALKGAGDVRLAATRSLTGLDPGATSAGSKTLRVPSIPTGTYYLLACADDTARVIENNDANNCLASATTVSVHP